MLIQLLIFECCSEKGTQGNILSFLSYPVIKALTEPA
jgi:hypothetical protein